MKKYIFPLLLLCFVACTKKDKVSEVPSLEDSIATVDTVTAEKEEETPLEVREPNKAIQLKDAEPTKQSEVVTEEASKAIAEPDVQLSGELNGHEWVDLGLSVKWATCNVGAGSPEAYGNYFAWGERKTKDVYTKENSFTTDSDINNITGHRRRDVARALWGEGWRLPTKAEVEELVSKCKTAWTTQKGVNGRLIKNSKTGASIFLPAAGYRGSEPYEQGQSGRYWTGNSESGDPNAEFLFFYSEQCNWHRDYRYYGLSVRPVTK